MFTLSLRLLPVLAGLFALALTGGTARAQADLEVLVATGDPAPGTAPGVVFSSFGTPVTNASGQVAFFGVVDGPGVFSSNRLGIWGPGAIGALDLLARSGNQAPGTPPGTVFSSFSTPLINAAGQVAFLGLLTGSGVHGSNRFGIWGPDASGALGLLARAGDRAPGTNDVFSTFSSLLLNEAGQVAFRGSLPRGQGPFGGLRRDFGIWGPDASGALGLLALEDARAPGTAPGAVFSAFGDPVLNAAGQVAFVGILTGSGVHGSNRFGIWGSDTMGALDLLVRAGDEAPGTLPDVVFGSFSSTIALNALGQLAFQGSLTGPDIDFSNSNGIWGPDATGALGLLARSGDPAPGTPPGTTFSGVFNPVLNAAGQVAFLGDSRGADVNASNVRGLWGSTATGALGLLARVGDPAPGTPPDVEFSRLFSPVLNAAGQVAFIGDLRGQGVNSANDRGVWGPAAAGALGLIAREGDVIETSPGSSAPIRFISFRTGSGNEDGRPSSLSDNSQTVSSAGLTSGGFVILLSNVNAPPVADAGPDQHLECAGPAGTPVELNGSGSSDPDGDALIYAWSLTEVPPVSAAALDDPTAAKPSFNADRLGDYTATLVVNDGTVDSGPDVVAVAVEDSLAPGVVAALTPLGEGDDDGDSDEGLFRIEFAAADTCDAAPALAAVLDVGNGVELPAVDGQTIEFEFEDEGVEIEQEDGILEIEAPSLTLR
ncbi:MAG: PKD domain-containing protein, partial [Kiloniellales bacterium]|nr:PKD domain-containing protein [Kiloniellales bacterium]